MRILLIDGDRTYAGCLRDRLWEEGFVVDHVASMEDADDAVSVAPYDAMLVGRSLPDGDGLDWVRAQRRRGCTLPMLIVTAEPDAADRRVEGLNAGADDYLLKPVLFDELVARLRAVLRRPVAVLDSVLRAGNVEFDPVTREVRVAGNPLRMPRRETCIFELLMRRIGRTVVKSALEEGLYSFEDEVSSNAIEVGIYRLRGQLMGAGATATVRTVRGTGYVLEADNAPVDLPNVPKAAILAAQTAVALVQDGVAITGLAGASAVAQRLSSKHTPDTNIAVVAAVLAISMAQLSAGSKSVLHRQKLI
jgi:DNA-binding response OmpR family regulator